MKYCKTCDRVYKNSFKFCQDDHTELTDVAEDIEFKCNCGCDKGKIEFLAPDYFLSNGHRLKGNYECKERHDKIAREVMESSASKFLVIDNDNDEIRMFEDSYEAEEYVKDLVSDYEFNSNDEEIETIIILKIYPLNHHREITKDLFSSGNTNMLFYDDEWYKVKSATCPVHSYDSEISVDLY